MGFVRNGAIETTIINSETEHDKSLNTSHFTLLHVFMVSETLKKYTIITQQRRKRPRFDYEHDKPTQLYKSFCNCVTTFEQYCKCLAIISLMFNVQKFNFLSLIF